MTFGVGEISRIRLAVSVGATMERLCRAWGPAGHSRDELIEAWWAIKRYPSDIDARDHVNEVLDLQGQRMPLINGQPHHEVTRSQRPVAMF